ncbi:MULTISPECIES: hypothetical protein [unclassified Mycolicibacterium]|uniref:hypothetical protein n=1 Tax=unclassified Mycolicibacterium TaxID=2636767 RepID=UPI0012DC14B9|nr:MULTISPECIES: hypothetical protein [unclassified Mycolicibacterium]MUL84158.1 hypothetical protein [Mycolicibacterium sp. CBMA 329]MUL89776.1 hypothetical protein [Mycolicibacterium sp. CBMA 331]MUL99950.1 hypothetical protein [Mycolicibacterium sp. CBMA 334]MUM27103.1 hypothetical protein [Mycolicibacterium sp. CBMA 295]MUM39291.1 hypothetical protein [Mycolicibacterium sp. CBMA 247]
MSSYSAVDFHDYNTYYNYPTTTGAQFVTPGGYRCRITYTGRANPPMKQAVCWGALPGTSSNAVRVFAAMTLDPATFSTVDLADMEKYTDYKEPRDRTVDVDDYKPLPAGRKLSYPNTGTCAVTEVSTVCVVGDHGFELSGQGSRVF